MPEPLVQVGAQGVLQREVPVAQATRAQVVLEVQVAKGISGMRIRVNVLALQNMLMAVTAVIKVIACGSIPVAAPVISAIAMEVILV